MNESVAKRHVHRPLIEWLLLCATLALIGGLIGYSLFVEHQRIEILAKNRLASQAKVISEILGRQFDAINHVLIATQSNVPKWKNQFDGQKNGAEYLRILTDAMPGVRTMTVLNAKGVVIDSNKPELIGSDFGQREYFLALQRNPSANTLHVGAPFKTSLGVFSMLLARAVIEPNGRFAGIVTATLDPEEFKSLLSSVVDAPDMVATLIHANGTSFVAIPSRPSAIGSNITKPDSFFTRHLQSGSPANVFTGPAAAYGSARMAALLTFQPSALAMDQPLVIGVGSDLDAIYSSWNRNARIEGGLFGVFGVLVLLSLSFYHRRRRLLTQAIADHDAERKQAQEALQASERRYREIFEDAPIGYHEFDSEGRLTRINNTELASLGYTEEEMLGHYVWEFNDSNELAHKAVLEKLAGISMLATNFERNYLKKDGTLIAFLIKDKILRDKAGNITGIRSTAMDISERKQAEDALRQAERYQRALLDNFPFPVWLKDENSRYLAVNQTLATYYGLPSVLAMTGKTDMDLSPPDLAEAYRADDREVMESGYSKQIEEFLETQGKRQWVETYKSPLFVNGTVRGTVGFARDITERKQAEEKINQLAFFDQLTELPNRTLLQDRLKQAMANSQRSGLHGALLLIDLDYFKTLNDTLGHDMGDLLLKQVAQRLTECMREEDTVARLGGDEFVVMLVSLSESQSEAASLIELVGGKINAALNIPFELKAVSYRISPSIGASVFLGQQTEIDTLLKQADLAMYKAKDAGRNTLRFFDPDMTLAVLKRASLDNDLREALQKKQFVLHYQAQMTGGQVTGAEALLRWQHPERGLVFPDEFISVIEETGLILPVGQWVLDTVCKQLADWVTQAEMSHLTVAVNISARQINHEDFVDQVLMAIDRSGANPERLKLELTESLLVNNVEDIIGKMTALKAKGVGFSLDDFGTGYSSLSYLKRLPLDQLKIDQSFVRDILTDPNDAEIAKMIIVLAESLGLAVIAEGVETEAQRDSLTQHGCHAYQGYFFSRPLPLDDFESFVKRV